MKRSTLLALSVAAALLAFAVLLTLQTNRQDADERCRDLHRRDVVTSSDVEAAEGLGCPL